MSAIEDVLEGRARWSVLCADCRRVLPQLPSGCVEHVVTDAPFDDSTCKGARSLKALNRRLVTFEGIDGDEGRLLSEALRLARRWVVTFCAVEQLGAYKRAAGKAWVRGTAWYRTNPAPQFSGGRPGQRYEGIAIAHRPGRKRWARHGECWAPVGPIAFEDETGDHPTPKPLWLMLELLEAFTEPNDLVVDPYCGTGTTGVACLRLGRRFLGIELTPRWAALARTRLNAEARGMTVAQAAAGQLSIWDALGGLQ
jgi:site-specific DNA-methyltransferase (adenine-specific)